MPINPIKVTDRQEGLPILQFIRSDTSLAAAISKSTPGDIQSPRNSDGSMNLQHVSPITFRNALMRRARRNVDNEAYLRLLPDLKLSSQILVSSILSPKNMMDTELSYELPKNVFGPNLIASLVGILKEHFTEDYQIEDDLSEILTKALVTRGSNPIAVIPENALDQFINRDLRFTTENFQEYLGEFFNPDQSLKPLGILGRSDAEGSQRALGLVLESQFNPVAALDKAAQTVTYRMARADGVLEKIGEPVHELVTVTDNPAVFAMARLNEKIERDAISHMYQEKRGGVSLGLESFRPTDLSDDALLRMVTPRRNQPQEAVAVLPSQNELRRTSVGAPLVMHMPSEAVMPVHVPGNVQEHIGYFILLDESGHPIDMSDDAMGVNSALSGTTAIGNSSLMSNITRRAEQNLGLDAGKFDLMNDEHMRISNQIFADMVDRDLTARIRNGAYGKDVTLAGNEDLYRVMWARTLMQKRTQMLYLPKQYVTYVAFEYGADGMGRSILDDQATINTMRVTLMMVDVIASMRNSIGLTEVEVNVPEHDANPIKTLEKVKHHIAQTRSVQIPQSVSNLSDITRSINQAGYLISTTGANKQIPDLKFSIQQRSTNYVRPDTDLRDGLKASSAMGFGLSPETVNNSFDPEFATTAMHNNLLLAKRVMMLQAKFMPLISDHVRKYITHHQPLLQKLREAIKEQADQLLVKWDDYPEVEQLKDVSKETQTDYEVYRALRELLSNLNVTLPKPTVSTLENQTEDLEKYDRLVDVALNGYFSDQIFTEGTSGEMAQQVTTFRGLIKSYLMRAYMAKTNIVPELSDLATRVGAANPKLDAFVMDATQHAMAITAASTKAFMAMAPVAAAANKDLASVGANAGAEAAPDTGGSYGGGGGDYGGGGGGGFDDFSLDDGGLGGDPLDDDGLGEQTNDEPTGENTEGQPGQDPLEGFERPAL